MTDTPPTPSSSSSRLHPVLFAHGLEGSPHGRKPTTLSRAGFEVTAPDGSGLSLARRLEDLEVCSRTGTFLLVGSSYGGLAAAILAQRHPHRFHGLVLCAPALALQEPPAPPPGSLRPPEGIPTAILHGVHDDVVPIADSRRYRDRAPDRVRLWELDDGHRLAESLDLLVEVLRTWPPSAQPSD